MRRASVFALLAVPLLTACASSTSTPKTENTLAHAPESWCPEGFETGPSDTCFAIPKTPTKETGVIVFLHGPYAGRGAPPEATLLKTALTRGFAVIIPRGKRGHCAWKAETKDNFCWPEEPDDPVAMKHIVAEWDRVLWQVDALLEGGGHKRYVLGFANGGSFGAHLALHNLFPTAQAFAIVDGAALARVPKAPKSVPLLVLEADAKAKELSVALTQSGWSPSQCPRSSARELSADDLDTALRFFEEDVKGR